MELAEEYRATARLMGIVLALSYESDYRRAKAVRKAKRQIATLRQENAKFNAISFVLIVTETTFPHERKKQLALTNMLLGQEPLAGQIPCSAVIHQGQKFCPI
jgi:hypothetical protein